LPEFTEILANISSISRFSVAVVACELNPLFVALIKTARKFDKTLRSQFIVRAAYERVLNNSCR
jgi:hypothetical protein